MYAADPVTIGNLFRMNVQCGPQLIATQAFVSALQIDTSDVYMLNVLGLINGLLSVYKCKIEITADESSTASLPSGSLFFVPNIRFKVIEEE